MHVNDSGQRVNTTSKARPVWHLSMVRVTHMCALEKLEPCPDSLPAAMYALARRRTPHLVILLQALLSSSSPPPSPAAATAAAAACSISISISISRWCLGWGRLSWLIALCHACIMLSVASHRLMHAMQWRARTLLYVPVGMCDMYCKHTLSIKHISTTNLSCESAY